MNLFHTHLFYESANPEILFCRCGKTKSLHQHIWERYDYIIKLSTEEKIGIILKCKVCGELKNHRMSD